MCSCGVQQAKKVSMEGGVKRPRGRPPLPETLQRRLKQQQQQQFSRSASESKKTTSSSSVTNEDERRTAPATVNPSPVTSPAIVSSPEPPPPPVVVKKRRKQGPRGMARLLVKRPGSKVNGSVNPSFRSPPSGAAELSPSKHHVPETVPESSNVGKPETAERCEQPMDMSTDQMIPSLSSPIWRPASKRVLDAVCVTDVTARTGVTVTVRESSVVDGFFRPRPEQP